MQGMLDTMNRPFLLALRFGEVYWNFSEVVSKNAFDLFITHTSTPTPGEMEHFQVLELELSAWEPFCTFSPHLKSQAAA